MWPTATKLDSRGCFPLKEVPKEFPRRLSNSAGAGHTSHLKTETQATLCLRLKNGSPGTFWLLSSHPGLGQHQLAGVGTEQGLKHPQQVCSVPHRNSQAPRCTRPLYIQLSAPAVGWNTPTPPGRDTWSPYSVTPMGQCSLLGESGQDSPASHRTLLSYLGWRCKPDESWLLACGPDPASTACPAWLEHEG